MFTLIKQAQIFAPKNLGRKDVLLAAQKIALIADNIELPPEFEAKIVKGQDYLLVPGFIDSHVHITGGGGEGGPATRTPEISLSSITTSGVTTVCGLLGTDGTTRSMENLLAKAQGLDDEGITTFIYVGAYQVPTPTITGSVRNDIVLIDKCIGAGEIAISDHRSSQPSQNEYTKIVAESRVGGMLSGKSGVVNVHTGDGVRGLEPLRHIIANTEIPYANMLPTHMNRNERLFVESLEYAKDGGYIDITSGIGPAVGLKDAIKPSIAIKRALAAGVPLERILMSSDGNGSMPVFDDEGNNIGVGVADQKSLLSELRDAVLDEGCSFEDVLSIVTANVARLLKLKGKGQIAVNNDADLLLLTKDYQISAVWAKGQLMVEDGEPVVFGTYEKLVR